MNIRKRKFVKEIKPNKKNNIKFDANVKVVGDKIRFKPKHKQG